MVHGNVRMHSIPQLPGPRSPIGAFFRCWLPKRCHAFPHLRFPCPRTGRPSRPSPRSVPPKVLEAVGRHLGVPDRVLNILVPPVMLQGPRVVTIVGELEPTGRAKHVRVDQEWQRLDEHLRRAKARGAPSSRTACVSTLLCTKAPMRSMAARASGRTRAQTCQVCGIRGHISSST